MRQKFSNIISHRGYHGDGIIENTLEAFSKSIRYSFPIELDVYLTKDHQLVVFHDSTLKRLMGIDQRVEDFQPQMGHADLIVVRKTKGDSGANFFFVLHDAVLLLEVLELVNGKVSLLIEVKRSKNYRKVCQALWELLLKYSGPVKIQSFDFRIVRWFLRKKRYPVGLLISPNPKAQYYWYYLLVNCSFFVQHVVRPDFVSYDIHGGNSDFLKAIRRANIPIYLWTIRTEKELQKAKKYGDFYITEGLGSFR